MFVLTRQRTTVLEIAYGRRRLRALKELRRKVRAIVLNLSDEELVIAQGQENSARLDLTFIEKVMFAIALDDHHYSRETIEAALTVDRTMAARLLALGRRIPPRSSGLSAGSKSWATKVGPVGGPS